MRPMRGYRKVKYNILKTSDWVLEPYRPRKVFESGGSNQERWRTGVLEPPRTAKAVLEVACGEGAPFHNTGAGVTHRENFGNFMCKMRRLGAKLLFIFIPSKLQIFPDFWSHMVLWSCVMEIFIHHITLQYCTAHWTIHIQRVLRAFR